MSKNITKKAPPRSYVIRNGRVTASQKKSIKENWSEFGVDPKKTAFKEIFPNNSRIIVEVGFGSGENLLHLSEDQNSLHFLGIEVYTSGIGALIRRAKKRGVLNLKVINHDARNLFNNFIAKESLEAVLIFHPDPWPKRKHNKRRLVNDLFIKNIYKALKRGGFLYFKTDSLDYFRKVNLKLNNVQGLKKIKIEELPIFLQSIPKSKYESKAITNKNQVNYLTYTKS